MSLVQRIAIVGASFLKKRSLKNLIENEIRIESAKNEMLNSSEKYQIESRFENQASHRIFPSKFVLISLARFKVSFIAFSKRILCSIQVFFTYLFPFYPIKIRLVLVFLEQRLLIDCKSSLAIRYR